MSLSLVDRFMMGGISVKEQLSLWIGIDPIRRELRIYIE